MPIGARMGAVGAERCSGSRRRWRARNQTGEVTGWQGRPVRGFFAGLKKRQGIAVEVMERVRQVGPDKQGARGSYSICRIGDAGWQKATKADR